MDKTDSILEILNRLTLKASKNPEKEISSVEAEANAKLREKELLNQALEKAITLRDQWSSKISWAFFSSLVFIMIFIVALGLGWFDFSKYPYFPHEIIGVFFVEVIGLGYIVVRCLFPNGKTL